MVRSVYKGPSFDEAAVGVSAASGELANCATDGSRQRGKRSGEVFRAFIKRGSDVVLSATMLVAAAPLMAFIAGRIWLADGGPVVYVHRRVGHNGKMFDCLKFRTMVKDSSERLSSILDADSECRRQWDATQKLDDDPRVIPGVGQVLRKTSLDELPQLFNILRGDMSIVGPRPIVSNELDKYGVYKSHYLSVKPGLTGPWQIGGRSDTTYQQRVSLDVWYTENCSFGTDLRILGRTLMLFLTGRLDGGR